MADCVDVREARGDAMRCMSFAMTPDAIRDRTKTVTRRLGWRFLKVGDLLRAMDSSTRTGTAKELAVIRVTDLRREKLYAITEEDVAREGLSPHMTPALFIVRFCQALGCSPIDEVLRIEFEYVEEER